MPSLEVVTAVLAGYLLSEILGDTFPDLAAHNVIHRRERRTASADQDGIVLGVGIGVADQYVEDDHVEQAHDIGRWHVAPRDIEHILQRRSAGTGLVRLVLCRWRYPQRLAVILLV
jgi:hypothetical protein